MTAFSPLRPLCTLHPQLCLELSLTVQGLAPFLVHLQGPSWFLSPQSFQGLSSLCLSSWSPTLPKQVFI